MYQIRKSMEKNEEATEEEIKRLFLSNLDFRTYYYEVELITADEDHYTFITGRLTIGREIENHESG